MYNTGHATHVAHAIHARLECGQFSVRHENGTVHAATKAAITIAKVHASLEALPDATAILACRCSGVHVVHAPKQAARLSFSQGGSLLMGASC